MLLYAKETYRLTDGKVNVAMGSVLSIWHDYREAGMDEP
jgi:thiamine biosynthesis lipoprotein